jgi:hypothetical protein
VADAAPKIDRRDFDAILREVRELAPVYTPEWIAAEDTGAGAALLKIFAKMLEGIIRRLNEVPLRNFVAFLEMVGIKLLPALPARVPVTFSLSAGAQDSVAIPARSQVAAGAPPDGGDPIVYETEKTLLATPAKLQAIYSIMPAKDAVINHTAELQQGTTAELFYTDDSKNLQEHSFFIGHSDLFNIKSSVVIELAATPASGAYVERGRARWEYCAGETKQKKNGEPVLDWRQFDKATVEQERILLKKDNADELKEVKVNGIKSRWIRCAVEGVLDKSDPLARLKIIDLRLKSAPFVAGAQSTQPGKMQAARPSGGVAPDAAFYNDLPLKVPPNETKPLTPFGPAPPAGEIGIRPRAGDIFYLASEEAFSKKGSDITLIVGDPKESDVVVAGAGVDIERVHGIGKLFTRRLRAAGVKTVADFLRLDPQQVAEIVRNRKAKIPASRYMVRIRNMREATVKEFYDKVVTQGPTEVVIGQSTPPARAVPVLSWEYWNGAGWVALEDLKDETNALTSSGYVSFRCPEDLTPTKVIGQNNYWIRVRIAFGDYGKEKIQSIEPTKITFDTSDIKPPAFKSFTISYASAGEPPQQILTLSNLQFNAPALPIAAPFAPFDALDDDHQSLYFGFDRAPLKGPIGIFFSLKEQEYTDENRPHLVWEYYRLRAGADAGEWLRLIVTDGTKNLTESGTIEFIGPPDFAPLSRFGQSLYWIRVKDINDKFVPLRDITQALEQTAAANDADADAPVLPRQRERGLHQTRGDLQHASRPAETRKVDALLHDLARYQTRLAAGRTAPTLDQTSPTLDQTSQTLDVISGSFRGLSVADLRRTATRAKAKLPIAHQASQPASLSSPLIPVPCLQQTGARVPVCGEAVESFDLPYTINANLLLNPFAPLVNGIYLNTAWAVQSETVADEIVGSSNGIPNQSFTLTKFPVIEEAIWVNEIGSLTESERKAFVGRADMEVRVRKDAEGNDTEFWVRWAALEDITEAGATARVYSIDRTFGQVEFGDGVRGMVPPIGRDNLRASYQAGGGARGNIPARLITSLRTTIPLVEKVINPEPSGGGSDTELLGRALERGPQFIKNRGRAITAEDFEWIAREASQAIARVKCLPTFNDNGQFETGWVTVIIVPASDEARPVPSPQLRYRVERYVRDRAPNVAAYPKQVKVTGPAYVEVRIAADLYPVSIDLAPKIETQAVVNVKAFLHPLTGSYTNTGWEFGRLPCLSDFYALLEGLEGVDHVENLTMTLQAVKQSGQYNGAARVVTEDRPLDIDVPDYALVYSGEHQFTVKVSG